VEKSLEKPHREKPKDTEESIGKGSAVLDCIGVDTAESFPICNMLSLSLFPFQVNGETPLPSVFEDTMFRRQPPALAARPQLSGIREPAVAHPLM